MTSLSLVLLTKPWRSGEITIAYKPWTIIKTGLDAWAFQRIINTWFQGNSFIRVIKINSIQRCVSSVIWGYDLQKQQPIFSIANKDGKATLNTINSLNFQQDSYLFLSGTRDGFIKLYDVRSNPVKPIQEVRQFVLSLISLLDLFP